MRFILLISLLLLLLCLLLLFSVGRQPPTVQAQAVDATSDRYLFLPLIRLPAPTPIKAKSGIHMGNQGTGADWRAEFFQRLRGTASGQWPAATVVLSNQLYAMTRSTDSPCDVITATVRSSVLFTYLTQAIAQGTKVVIRVYPSPGNFIDYASPGQNHLLRADQTPAGGDYCGNDQSQKVEQYRDIGDIVHEMDVIQRLNVSQGWPKEGFFFEPANEPNNEWYTEVRERIRRTDPNALLIPYVDNKTAWVDMDHYFANLDDLAQQTNSNLLVLTPPMGQENWAEHYSLHTCNIQAVLDGSNPTPDQSGYDFLSRTYGEGRFAGFSWHNYWLQGQSHEAWGEDVITTCRHTPGARPSTDHVYQYFPEWMQRQIAPSGKPTFITEADLYSICIRADQPIVSKVLYPISTQLSLRRFFAEEQGARYVIGWLLVQADDGSYSCFNNGEKDANYEIAWHEAVQADGVEYEWFALWWTNTAE